MRSKYVILFYTLVTLVDQREKEMKLVKKTCPCTKPICATNSNFLIYDQKNDFKKKNLIIDDENDTRSGNASLSCHCLILLNSYLTLDNHREDHTAPCRKVGWSLGWPCIFFSILHSNLGPCYFLQPHLKKPTPPSLRLSAVLPSSLLPWFLSSHLWYICNVRRVLNIYSEDGGGRAGFIGVGVGWGGYFWVSWIEWIVWGSWVVVGRNVWVIVRMGLGYTLKKNMGILKLTLGVKFDQKWEENFPAFITN